MNNALIEDKDCFAPEVPFAPFAFENAGAEAVVQAIDSLISKEVDTIAFAFCTRDDPEYGGPLREDARVRFKLSGENETLRLRCNNDGSGKGIFEDGAFTVPCYDPTDRARLAAAIVACAAGRYIVRLSTEGA